MNDVAVDSQSFIWFLEGNSKLSKRARDLMAEPSTTILLPVIAICECVRVLEKGKKHISQEDLRIAIEETGRVAVVALDYAIARIAMKLNGLDGIHDQLIVATVMHHRQERPDLALITADRLITESNLVPTIW